MIKDFEVFDYNRDGYPDFTYTDNHFPAEVETARYDGLIHGVCTQAPDGHFQFKPITGLPIRDYRSLKILRNVRGEESWLYSVNDNKPILAFRENPHMIE